MEPELVAPVVPVVDEPPDAAVVEPDAAVVEPEAAVVEEPLAALEPEPFRQLLSAGYGTTHEPMTEDDIMNCNTYDRSGW